MGSSAQTAVRYVEHRVPREGSSLYVKEYEGLGPAFLLLHGFPDNHHIYDPLAEALASAGRHVVSFDFLGFGNSDKPSDFSYNFDQQLADLEAVIEHLNISSVVPVAHDAGGFSAINYLAKHTHKVAHLVLLNTFYTNAPTLRPPELVLFFATPGLSALSKKMASDPNLMDFLLTFQQTQFKHGATEKQRSVIDGLVRPIISENFRQQPSATTAFSMLVSDMIPQIGKNTATVHLLKGMKTPCTIVWGQGDAYLNTGVAKDFRTIFSEATIHELDAGHWPQLDLPAEVAEHLLAEVKV